MKQLNRVATFALVALLPMAANAELSAEELAKLAQNPVGNLISLPFQNNSNLNYGPLKKTQNILNIQPVIPIEVSPEWNVITRTIVPVVGKIFHLGRLPVNTSISAYYNVIKPTFGPNWQIRAQVQLMFPK